MPEVSAVVVELSSLHLNVYKILLVLGTPAVMIVPRPSSRCGLKLIQKGVIVYYGAYTGVSSFPEVSLVTIELSRACT